MRKYHFIEFESHIDYGHGVELQKKAFDLVRNSDIDGIVLALQHKAVLTTGSSGGSENLLVSRDVLRDMEIDVYESSWGGNVTYHGPGQLVVYPILDLTKLNKDLHWYLRQLEESVIRTLGRYSIEAGRKPEYTGVWINDRKIAAVGVHVKKWITMHGFAFNLTVDKSHFDLINPCGIKEYGIASLDDYIDEVDYREVLDCVRKSIGEVFEIDLVAGGPGLLE